MLKCLAAAVPAIAAGVDEGSLAHFWISQVELVQYLGIFEIEESGIRAIAAGLKVGVSRWTLVLIFV